MKSRILFIHLPKTAGTSFRMAAKDYFGERNVFFDYGVNSPDTSSCILKNIYQEKDFYKLYQFFQEYEEVFVSGHFNVGKYMTLFEAMEVVTFVRNPVEQVISHFNHFCRNYGYEKSLRDFAQDNTFKNVQSKLLTGKPLELFGFVGLTEEYDKSIQMINHLYNTDIKSMQENKNPNSAEEIDEEIISLIKNENKQDLALYSKAKVLFNERYDCFKRNTPFIYNFIQNQSEHSIRGIAYESSGYEPVRIEITNDENNKIACLDANDFRPGFVYQNLPRKGYVGYEFNNTQNGKISAIVRTQK